VVENNLARVAEIASLATSLRGIPRRRLLRKPERTIDYMLESKALLNGGDHLEDRPSEMTSAAQMRGSCQAFTFSRRAPQNGEPGVSLTSTRHV
jgi:hypothetical protein